jgi:hypothetical protein
MPLQFTVTIPDPGVATTVTSDGTLWAPTVAATSFDPSLSMPDVL